MINFSIFSEEKIFLTLLIVSIIEYTYSSSEPCGCTLRGSKDNGDERRLLTNLKDHSLCDGRSFQADGGDQYQYHFVICGEVGDSPNVTLEKRDTAQVGNNTPLGYKNSTNIVGMTGPSAWMLLTFYSSSIDSGNNSLPNSSKPSPPPPSSCQTHSSVMLICDKNYPGGEFRVGYHDVDNCLYVFELRIAALCDETGMSGFSIFLIILVVVFALYFICGVLYNRTQLGAKGINQIPHRGFWFGLGNKFADCFSALCRCDQYCSSDTEHLDTHSQYSGGYSPIGESSAKQPGMTASPNYERDSQLISP